MRQEIHRQFIHFLGGTILIALVIATTVLGIPQSTLVAGLIGLFVLGYVFVRKKYHHRIGLLHSLIKHVTREAEKDEFPAKPAFILLAGAILTLAFFSPLASIVGLCILTFGDTVATLVGKYRGKIELISDRTLEGTVAGILVSFLALYFFLSPEKAIGIAIVGMLAEYLPIDDNIGIPVVGALAASLLL
jgi:dolichol kinase